MVSLSSYVFYLYLTISLKVEMYISEIDYTKFIRNTLKIFQFNCTIPLLVVKLIIKKKPTKESFTKIVQ